MWNGKIPLMFKVLYGTIDANEELDFKRVCLYRIYALICLFIDYVLSSVCYISAVLLLCDYGMFSSPTPSSTERTTVQILNTSDSNTIVTAESTIFGNFTEADEDDELDDERPEPPTNASHENASVPNITVNTSAGLDRNSVEATPRTARPESTTHRRIIHYSLLFKMKLDESMQFGLILPSWCKLTSRTVQQFSSSGINSLKCAIH